LSTEARSAKVEPELRLARAKEDAVTSAPHGFRAIVLVGLLLVPVVAAAQESKSAALAAELARLLDEQKLESVAAQQDAEHYVGALYFPGAQLLVVSGKYASAARMKDLLAKKDYREVYLDLSSASDQKTRTFIMDLGANGLRFRREDNQPFDTADVAGKSVTFDGDWDRAKISEDEYRKTYAATDQRYAEMLQALIATLKKPS
jgi:hypothetical protein